MPTASQGPPDPGGGHARFPALAVRSLAGVDLLLPGDLPAPRTLVLCAFRQAQQPMVDEWIRWAVNQAGVAPSPLALDPSASSVVVESPVIGRRYRPARRFIDGGMARNIRLPDVLARTLTTYIHVDDFCRGAGIASAETVAALVVRPDGAVLAHVSGPPEPAACAVVTAALA